MFSARDRGCDHMLYDGACECIERPNVGDSDDFLLALAAALMEEPILLFEQSQAEQYLADECAENDADQARLAEYLAELELEDNHEWEERGVRGVKEEKEEYECVMDDGDC